MNILHSEPWRGLLSEIQGDLYFGKDSDYPSEKDVYEWAGIWKWLRLRGEYGREYGLNFSSFFLRGLQNMLNGEVAAAEAWFHQGPWNFPFINEKELAFEEKYNVSVILITQEGYSPTKPSTFGIIRIEKPESISPPSQIGSSLSRWS
ncbi:unnamed protein product, partial [Mesorhabditis spiculigera]